jgi:hypothetical protein
VIWWQEGRVPFSILVGGALSLISLRIIVWSVQEFLGPAWRSRSSSVISTIKIFVMFAIMVVLAVFGLLNVVAMITAYSCPDSYYK